MRLLRQLAGVWVLAMVSAGTGWAGDFEGVIHMTMKHADSAPTKMDWMIKGGKARIEVGSGDGKARAMIVDARTRTMLMPIPEQKTYMEMKMPGSQGELLKESLQDTLVERTGKRDTVAGYACEIWLMKDKSTQRLEHDVCVAKGFGRTASFWMDPKEVQRSSQPAWVKQLVTEGGFGMRSISYADDGTESSRMEVTRVEKKTLDGALFSMPADWKKQDMSAMQEQMKAMQERMKAGRGQEGQKGQQEIQRMIEEIKKRRAERGAGGSTGEGGPPPDINEIMKQLSEMKKKQGAQ